MVQKAKKMINKNILEIVILGKRNYFSFLSPHNYSRLHLDIVDNNISTYYHLVSRDQEPAFSISRTLLSSMVSAGAGGS